MNILQTIERCAGYRGMSDDQLRNERVARDQLDQAIEKLRIAIAKVNDFSAVVQINADAFEDFVSDEIPAAITWDDRISEARAM